MKRVLVRWVASEAVAIYQKYPSSIKIFELPSQGH